MGVVLGVMSIVFAGSAVISNLEGWTFLDAVYFSVITGSGVGYGDITPKHPGSKIFVIVYMYVLIVVIILVIGFLASMRRNIAMDRRKVEILNRPVDLAWLSELGSDDGIDKCVFVFGVLEQLGYVTILIKHSNHFN